MNVIVLILFVLAGFIALYFPRFFLRKYRSVSSSDLTNARKTDVSRQYPWIQLSYAAVTGISLFTCGFVLWPTAGTKVYSLLGSWVALLGGFDGWFAAKTGVYPLPEKIGYFYALGNDEYICKLGKIHLCVGVTVAAAIIAWVIFL
jgi:hypothetical protein